MSDELVSIIIPVYNGENYLSEAVHSAINQTYPNIEVIVVNDGSTDSTEEICQSFGDKIRYFKKENGGTASAVNYGISQMNGEYFSWLSHDDMYHLDKIEKQLRAIHDSGSSYALVHGNYNVVNEKYHSITTVRNDLTYSLENMSNSVMPVLLAAFHGCVPLVHRSHFKRIGLFDESLKLTQDFDFYFRAMRGQQTIFVDEPLVDVRVHETAGRIVNVEFERACANQYLHFANNLDMAEVRDMFGDENIFYFRTAAMMCSRNMFYEASIFLINHNCTNANQYDFKHVLETNIGCFLDNTFIFGMGFRGKTLLLEMLARNIIINGFVDNNEMVNGKSFCGIECVNLTSIENKEDITVLVAVDDSAAIIEQLKSNGVTKIITMQQLEKELLKYPPIKIEVIYDEMAEQRA